MRLIVYAQVDEIRSSSKLAGIMAQKVLAGWQNAFMQYANFSSRNVIEPC